MARLKRTATGQTLAQRTSPYRLGALRELIHFLAGYAGFPHDGRQKELDPLVDLDWREVEVAILNYCEVMENEDAINVIDYQEGTGLSQEAMLHFMRRMHERVGTPGEPVRGEARRAA